MALPRTPFAPDPGYEKTSNFYPQGPQRDPTPSGRVRPEATDIARAHTSGSVGLLFEAMAHPPTVKSKYKRQDPKNFAKENMRKIREIQSQSKRKAEERSKPLQPVQRSDKYSHVQARVTPHIQGPRPPSDGRPSSGHGVRWGPDTHCESSTDTRVPVNGTDCRGSLSEPRERRSSKNFVAANVSFAGTSTTKRPPSRQKQDVLEAKKKHDLESYQRGTVPQYLRKRQDEWRRAEEERIASLPDPSVPPGHTVMPTKERLKTLEILREHQTTLTAELNSLPLQSVTLRVKQRKAALDSKLTEIEDALKIFSRPKVFVKSDE